MAKQNLTTKLTEIKRKEEEERTKKLADKMNLPYLDMFAQPVDSNALKLVPQEKAEKAGLVVLHKKGKKIEIGTINPDSPFSKKILDELKEGGYEYTLLLVSRSGLKQALEHYKEISMAKETEAGQMEISASLISQLQEEITDFEKLKLQIKEISAEKTSELLETMIAGALKLDASDVHLEPKQNETILKYRLDGLLYEAVSLQNKAYKLILSRVKLLSGMKLNIHDNAQDGRFTIGIKDIDIEIRSSAIPGSYGENIVLRILNPKTISLDLEDLGFRQKELQAIEREIKKPNGLIITTGPTGSGKTTTLYAFIKKISRPEVKIITLEDPVEYHLQGITQTQVDSESGYTFASGLRSILRQDPDIILVGEIRDSETAKTALNASLTGHLVFSTLHTNDAAGAIPRLIDLGVDAGSLASSLQLMMAQRLIRRLCQKCKKEFIPEKGLIDEIKATLKDIEHPPVEKAKFFTAGKCQECHGLGFKGRVAVLELIPVDDEAERLITESPSHADVLELAKKKGMITMRQDGLLKVLAGLTTIEEVDRVVD